MVTFTFDNPAGTYDRINGTGTLTLDPGLFITVNGFNGYTPMLADVWTVLGWSTIVPNGFNPGTDGRTGGSGGGSLDLPDVSSYFLAWNVGNFTTDGTLSFVVPEPSRALLMLFGLAAFFMRRRRKVA